MSTINNINVQISNVTKLEQDGVYLLQIPRDVTESEFENLKQALTVPAAKDMGVRFILVPSDYVTADSTELHELLVKIIKEQAETSPVNHDPQSVVEAVSQHMKRTQY